MIGIYQDDFLDYLRDHLGDHIKTTNKNIITPCPFCEYGKQKDHYHLYISLEAPIFHCFHAGCEVGGVLSKLMRKIAGHDVSDEFIDKDRVNEYEKLKTVFVESENQSKIVLPPIRPLAFPLKEQYIQKRLKYANIPTSSIKGLIYDIHEFINLNKIPVDETLFRLRDYLHANFIGFLTENKSKVMFRNIDDSHTMRFFKLQITFPKFLDYYKLPGNNPKSNTVVLAEGIFDIFTAYIFDHLDIKQNVNFYASCLSSKYSSLIQSIVYNYQLFQVDVMILSDRGIEPEYYKKLKFFNQHIIRNLYVYYNKYKKDFNETPIDPEKIVI